MPGRKNAKAKPKLDGYTDVAERVQLFYKDYPPKDSGSSIQSDIILDDGKRVVIKAYAFRSRDDAKPGIGHAEEVRGEGMVNKTSAVENCETSAWGRALAALGYGGAYQIASVQEVEIARAKEADGRVVDPEADVIAKVKETFDATEDVTLDDLGDLYERAPWQENDLLIALVAVGVEDVEDVPVAMKSLTAQQRVALASKMRDAIDSA